MADTGEGSAYFIIFAQGGKGGAYDGQLCFDSLAVFLKKFQCLLRFF
jgi:hypothetical protein